MSSDPHIASIASRIAPFHVGDERLGVLLALSVGRLMLRSAKKDEDRKQGFSDQKIRHVADWLKAATVNGAAWLDNVDDLGRPKKLLKHPTFDALLAEVDRAMLVEAQRLGKVRLVEGDEALHAQLPDGMMLIRLLTPAALDRESSVMQHCIGNGGYDDFLGQDAHLFLSLRDRNGKAHATLEINNGKITQLQGKQNKPPLRKYVDALIPLIRQNGYRVSVPASDLGYVIDKDGDWHDLNHLPYGLTVGGYLDLSHTDITVLPGGLIVGGSLYLGDTVITVLPGGLTVGGSLYLGYNAITALPDGLTVGGNLDLAGTGITVLPMGLTVGGSLYLSGSDITALPDGLTVGVSISLSGTGITVLPDSIADTVEINCEDGTFSAAEFRHRFHTCGQGQHGFIVDGRIARTV